MPLADRPLIIAELSGNHGGSLDRAMKLIDAANYAGADAIKTQAFFPDRLTLDSDGPGFIVDGGVWGGRKLIDLYRETAMPIEWHAKLFDYAESLGLKVGASVFCKESADHIDGLNPDFMKIASFEITDLPLIRHVYEKGRQVIISTGVADDNDITDADKVCESNAIFLHCCSSYPADAQSYNLKRIDFLSRWLGTPVGLSDHSLSVSLRAVAIGLGASVIEKHLTLSRDDGGADASFSLEPDEFRKMSDACCEAYYAVHTPRLTDSPHAHLRRSLYVVEDMKAGDVFTDVNTRSIRPGFGLHPKWEPLIIGRKAAADISRGTPLMVCLVANEVREAVGKGHRVF